MKNLEGNEHYKKLKIDPFEYAMQNELDPLQLTIIKYVTRFRDKGGLRDLREAIRTIERLIEWEENQSTTAQSTNGTALPDSPIKEWWVGHQRYLDKQTR